MIVRLNSAGLQNAATKSSEHIGVEGDPPSKQTGGIRETEAIVGTARKGMPVEPVADDPQELSPISSEMIQEEDPGPELDAEGLTKAREKAKEGQIAVNTGDVEVKKE